MKKILNDPFRYVDEALEGMCLAHPQHYQQIGHGGRVIVHPEAPINGKVGIVSGGGSGHLPVFAGYVGDGLLDACAVGDVFSAPNVDQMTDAIKRANSGNGVLLLYGNYGGDRMNFEMAAELVEMEDIRTQTVLVTDDVASAGHEEATKRRGIAGIAFAYKIAGAKAADGADLDAVMRTTQKAVDNIRTMGVALSPCTIPAAGNPTFELRDNEMEIGMGIHGEPGVRRGSLAGADEIAEEILTALLGDLPYRNGDRCTVMCNSLGATPPEELYIVYRYIARKLEDSGIAIVNPLVGRYATSMEMTGMSVTLFKLDDELEFLLRKPCDCAYWKV